MVRLLLSILLGVAVTFGLFVFMAELIANSVRAPDKPSPTIVFDIVMAPKAAKANERRTPPPPPPPPKVPPKVPPVEVEPAEIDPTGVTLSAPVIQTGGSSGGFSGPSMINQTAEAQPIVRIEPKYPMKAERDGITGYVVMKFTIDETGGVEDVEVIEAEPKRVFDREAIRALKKWKYKPKVEEGKPMKQFGQTVRLDFNLQNE